MKSRIIVIVSALAVAAMCVFIFWMSAQNEDDSGAMSMGVVYHIIGFIVPGYDQMSPAEQLHWQEMLDHPVRKTAHFLEYMLLGALMMNLVVQVARARDERRAQGAKGAKGALDGRDERRVLDERRAQGVKDARDVQGLRDERSERDGSSERGEGSNRSTENGTVEHARFFERPLVKFAAYAWAFATLYAVSDEIHQNFVPGRACLPTDVLLDSTGVLVGVVIAALVFSRVFSRREKYEKT